MDVVLRDLSTGRDVAPEPQFFVSYRFNALGFRGPDYAIPAPEGTFRILALGDSYTLGVGVHEQENVCRAAREPAQRGGRCARSADTI